MLIDFELFFYEKFEKDEHYSQGGNIPVEGYLLEGVGQTVKALFIWFIKSLLIRAP